MPVLEFLVATITFLFLWKTFDFELIMLFWSGGSYCNSLNLTKSTEYPYEAKHTISKTLMMAYLCDATFQSPAEGQGPMTGWMECARDGNHEDYDPSCTALQSMALVTSLSSAGQPPRTCMLQSLRCFALSPEFLLVMLSFDLRSPGWYLCSTRILFHC